MSASDEFDSDSKGPFNSILIPSVRDFASIVEALPNLVFVTDVTGANIYTNRRFQDYTRLTAAQLSGDGWLSAVHPEDRSRVASIWETARRAQETYEAQYRFCGEDGEHRWHMCRASPLREDGRITGWVGSCSDIDASVALRTRDLTKSNRGLQAEIKRREIAQAALIQAQKLEALGQLTSGIAHDFNNILAAIAGGFALIEKKSSDKYVVNIARQCQSAAMRGAKIVKQMLAFARQEVLEPESVDLKMLAREVEPLIRQAIPGNTIAFDLPADLPMVVIDRVLFEAALLNLAVNANYAMPGGGSLTISARSCPMGEKKRPIDLVGRDAVAITVRDTGTGMPPEVLQRVTEPFLPPRHLARGPASAWRWCRALRPSRRVRSGSKVARATARR